MIDTVTTAALIPLRKCLALVHRTGASDARHGRSPQNRLRYTEFRDRAGVEATRYGDWEYAGRCTDFF